MILAWLRRPKSIFTHTLVLMIGAVLGMALLNIGLIVLRPPPRHAPLSSYEVARLLQGKTVAAETQGLTTRIEPRPPGSMAPTPDEALVARAVAIYLHADPANVRVRGANLEPHDRRGARFASTLQRELALYASDEQFNPHLFGAFSAAMRLPDGRWRVVRREGEALDRWQTMTVWWIGVSVLVLLPFAWLFSRWIAQPISQFATAADSVGRRRQLHSVDVKGPLEVRLAATAVNEMQTRLRRFLTERTSVVGAIAHDLRTPLSRLAFLIASAPDAVRAKAEAEIAEMESMITSTLDFVQSEARVQPKERLDLSLLVEGVADDLTDLGRDVRVSESVPITIVGDPILLKRVFANLLTNAVTYGRRAEIRIQAVGSRAVVEIADEGPGIAPASLERVFEPFYRTESSRNRTTGGIGLGLAIVEAAVTAHEGTVQLANRPTGGLTATVSLPIDGQAARPSPTV